MELVIFMKNSFCNLIVDKKMLMADDHALMSVMAFLITTHISLSSDVALFIIADETM